MTPTRRPHRAAFALILAGLALLPGGCHHSTPPKPEPQTGTGTSTEALVREAVTETSSTDTTRYNGSTWSLVVASDAGWQPVDAPTATFALSRPAGDVELHLSVCAYPIREGMPMVTFLAALALWRIEENLPRVEPELDEEAGVWRGYAIGDSGEAYYGFFTGGARGYVLEMSAMEGVVKPAATEEFSRILADFECVAQPGLTAP